MRLVLAMLSLLVLTSRALAQAGPPLITDDPGTPGDRKWEINVPVTVEQTPGQRTFEVPLLDLNYGVGEHVQLTYQVAPFVVDGQDEGPRGTLSNSQVGVKWRFLDEDEHGVAMSIFPQVEFNNPGSNAADRGLVDDGTQVFVPIEIARNFGKFELDVEVGYNFIQHADDEWRYGIAAAYPVTKRLELAGEIAGIVDQDFHRNDLMLNVGFRYDLTDQMKLLFSAGRSLRSSLNDDEPNLLVYAGVQFHF